MSLSALVTLAAGVMAGSFFFLFVGRTLLNRLGVVDVPNSRSSHQTVKLRGGGIGPLAGLVTALIVLLALGGFKADTTFFAVIAGASIAAAILGALEDIRGLRIVTRMLWQLIIAGTACYLLIMHTVADWWLLIPLTVALAAYINVANFMDGINGISSLHGLVAGCALALSGLWTEQEWLIVSGLLVALLYMSFLPWNLVGAGIFLGDVGSYLLGALVGLTAIAAWLSGVPFLAAFGATFIYVVDTGYTVVRRLLRGEKWYEPHRTHVYQRLTDSGLRHVQAASLVAGFSALSFLAGAVTFRDGWWAAPIAVLLLLLLGALYLWLPSRTKVVAPTQKAKNSDVEQQPVPQANATAPTKHVVPGEKAHRRWVVLGGSGFVGRSIVDRLQAEGHVVESLRAPRIVAPSDWEDEDIFANRAEFSVEREYLRSNLAGADVVINAAGLAAPDGNAPDALIGANGVLPLLVAEAAFEVGVSRFIHLSSAAVQGRMSQLDESTTMCPFSPYSLSKALGERALLRWTGEEGRDGVVIVRATSVQGAGRRTTQGLQRIAAMPLASVARPGDQPTPVVSVAALAEFVHLVASHQQPVPTIVLQPWEGMTASSVLRIAGGREPLLLNRAFCRVVIASGYAVSRLLGGALGGTIRRIELMWFGQRQVSGWAQQAGAYPTAGIADVLGARHKSVATGRNNG